MEKVHFKRAALKPFVPEWLIRRVLPQYEGIGPKYLERADLSCHSHESVFTRGEDFFIHLQTERVVHRTLGLEDGLLLIEREVVSLWFPGRHLCLWRSAALDTFGNVFVPWIQNIRGQRPVIRWWWLEYQLYPSHHTVLFDERLHPCHRLIPF